MERALSRENISVPEPAYEDYDRGATLVETGVPFQTDMEARDRKLKRNEKVILKDKIYSFLYDNKGNPRLLSAFITGSLLIASIIGFFYCMGRVALYIGGSSPDHFAKIMMSGLGCSVILLVSGVFLTFIGSEVMGTVKPKKSQH